MSRKIVFYFPKNYLHGNPGKEYYMESVNILSVSPRTPEFMDSLFKNTELYIKLKYFSFVPYFEFKYITTDNGVENFIAVPNISVFYGKDRLKYFHVPTYEDVKHDFYLLTGTKNNIKNSKKLIINEPPTGKYIVSL